MFMLILIDLKVNTILKSFKVVKWYLHLTVWVAMLTCHMLNSGLSSTELLLQNAVKHHNEQKYSILSFRTLKNIFWNGDIFLGSLKVIYNPLYDLLTAIKIMWISEIEAYFYAQICLSMPRYSTHHAMNHWGPSGLVDDDKPSTSTEKTIHLWSSVMEEVENKRDISCLLLATLIPILHLKSSIVGGFQELN